VTHPAFFSGVAKIILLDLVLSGDNAVVIGMAAHRLEPRQRRFAIVSGGGAAILTRILLTAAAAFLLGIIGLQLVGGLLLIGIAFRLLKADEERHEGVAAAASMREAIATILIADVVMSFDNVLSVAAASAGDVSLLIFGLILSMAILMFMGSLVANLINRFWWLAYVGSAVITWTGVEMMLEDRWVVERLGRTDGWLEHAAALVVTMATLALAHWLHRVRPMPGSGS
jgi:YjbE family integral membrane protein